MTDLTLLLTLLYVVLAFLLVCLCLFTPWKLWVKGGMVAVVTASYFFAQGAFQDMRGWPSYERLPKKFVLLASVIEEPNKEKGTKGAIYVWVNALEESRLVAQPRAYKVPYQKEFHASLNEANRKIRQGVNQIGSTEAPAGGNQGGWLKNAADPNTKVKISDAPAPQLPEK
jgi:hypothetical protein